MQMFIHELKSNYKSLLGWSAAIVFFQLSGYSKFEGFQSAQSGAINNITNSFPKSLQVIFGMYNLNIATLIGYFGILYLYFALLASIYSGLLGAGIVSKEERDKTSEFLLTRPVSRNSILSAKLLAGLVNIFILFLVISLSSVIGVALVNHNFALTGQVIGMMWGILLFQILFFSLGLLFAGIFQNPKLPTAIVTILIVGTYFLFVLADISSQLNWVRFITPFKWFAVPAIIQNGHISYTYSVITIIVSVLAVMVSYIAYSRRDITVA